MKMADEHKKTRKGKSVKRIIEWIVTKVKILNYKIKKNKKKTVIKILSVNPRNLKSRYQ